MKKLLLLVLSGSVALVSMGQERSMFVSGEIQGKTLDHSEVKNMLRTDARKSGYQQKTTAADRWYSYPDYFDTSQFDAGPTAAIVTSYMWKDTMAVMAYSGGVWAHNRNVSEGLVIDPSFAGFNSYGYYHDQMKIMPENAYSVDSVRFLGFYGFNTANTYVDTIRVTFVYGNGDRGNGLTGPDVYLAKTGNPVVLTAYGQTDSMSTYRMHFDSVNVRTNGTTAVVRDLILNNTGASPAWGDTLSTGLFQGKVGFPAVNVPAGNLIGATITFISGDPTFTAHDTVFRSGGTYKHNMFRMASIFSGTFGSSGPVPGYAPYSSTDHNSGLYKTLPDTANKWGAQYIPLWFWSASGGGPSTNQYPVIDFHIKCPTCGVVTGVVDVAKVIEAGAYPNPSTGELNIPFTLSGLSKVSVSLSNTLGQEVARRDFGRVDMGKAVFNTASLAPGVYIYTVSYDDRRYTGRVSITN